MTMIKTDEELEHILEFYHKPALRDITDYTKVVANHETIIVDGTTLHKFKCPMQTIYLDETGYPVTIDHQKVDTENNAYFYKWNDDPEVEEDIAYEYVNRYEYMKSPQPWQPTNEEEEEEE